MNSLVDISPINGVSKTLRSLGYAQFFHLVSVKNSAIYSQTHIKLSENGISENGIIARAL